MTSQSIKTAILFPLALMIFNAYWVSTILYLLPESSPLNSHLERFNSIFREFAFQRWAFFAPPPVFDYKLYYIFKSKSSELPEIRLEVYSPILAEKRNRAPFNDSESVMDYVIYGAMSQVEQLAKIQILEFYKNGQKINGKESDENTKSRIKDTISANLDSEAIKTLRGYGAIVAQKNNIPQNYNITRFEITIVDIPAFEDRKVLSKPIAEQKREEHLVVKSTEYTN